MRARYGWRASPPSLADLFAGLRSHFQRLAVPLLALACQALELGYQHAFRQVPPEPPRHVQAQGIRVEAGRVERMAVIGTPQLGPWVFGTARPLPPLRRAAPLIVEPGTVEANAILRRSDQPAQLARRSAKCALALCRTSCAGSW